MMCTSDKPIDLIESITGHLGVKIYNIQEVPKWTDYKANSVCVYRVQGCRRMEAGSILCQYSNREC